VRRKKKYSGKHARRRITGAVVLEISEGNQGMRKIGMWEQISTEERKRGIIRLGRAAHPISSSCEAAAEHPGGHHRNTRCYSQHC